MFGYSRVHRVGVNVYGCVGVWGLHGCMWQGDHASLKVLEKVAIFQEQESS